MLVTCECMHPVWPRWNSEQMVTLQGISSKNINTLWTHCKGFVVKYFLVDVSTDLFVGFPSLPPSLRVIVVVKCSRSWNASLQAADFGKGLRSDRDR
jgi:hypothetical protein